VNVSFWWERVIVCNAALERHPGDRLARQELKLLMKMKDELVFKLGDLGLAVIGQCWEESVPQ
jgi:hypothetical protein